MKKFLSLTLAFAMLFAIAVPSYATNNDVKVEILERKEDVHGGFIEISKISDIYYYFEMCENYSVSISAFPDGTVHKYINTFNDKNIQMYIGSTKYENLSATRISPTLSTLSFKFEKNIPFEYSYKETTRVANLPQDIYDEIATNNYGGPQYYATPRSIREQSGKTCYIYETYTHNVILHGTLYFDIGVELAIIASQLNIPVAILLQKLIPSDRVILGAGVLALGIDLGTFSARLMNTQFAQIDERTYFSAGKTRTYAGAYSMFGHYIIPTPTTNVDVSYYNNWDAIAMMAFSNYFSQFSNL